MPVQTNDRPIGILLTNLGTPASPSQADIRRFLAEFLGDPRVIDWNRLLWLPMLYGYVLTTRPTRAAEAYRKIWTDEGSPLLVHAQRQAAAVRQRLNEILTAPVQLQLGMRYGEPSLTDALQQLCDAGCDRILLLPLYPQYSTTTTATTFDKVAELFAGMQEQPALRSITRYCEEPAYIDALADSVRRHWQEHGRSQRLLMSFHGIPQRYADNGDPYPDDCETTARLLAERLQLEPDAWLLSYQSRFGREPWLQPYTDDTLAQWARDGVESVDVICPGFSADCLETLEEIELDYHELFTQQGGQYLSYVPALNDDAAHIDMLARLVEREIAGWT